MVVGSDQTSSVARAADGFCALALIGLSVVLSDRYMHHATVIELNPHRVAKYLVCAVLFALIWNKCVGLAGLYSRYRQRLPWVISRSARVSLFMTLILVLFLMPIGGRPLSMPLVTIFFMLAFLYESVLFLVKTMGTNASETTIIVGTGRRAQKAWRELRVAQHAGADFAGFVDDCSKELLPPDIRERYLATIEDLPAYLLEHPVDVMIVATSLRSNFDVARNAVAIADLFDLKVVCLEDEFELGHEVMSPRNVTRFTELAIRDEAGLFRRGFQYMLDKLLATTLLVLLSPVLVVLCGVTRLMIGGPAMISELRYGYHRKRFAMLSLNTVKETRVGDAAMSHAAVETAAMGRRRMVLARQYSRFIRAARLDVLPRLWNVVRGEMSLLGPEAMATAGSSPLKEAAWAKMFRVRPGLYDPSTGLSLASSGATRPAVKEPSFRQSWHLDADAKVPVNVAWRWLGRRMGMPVPQATAPPAIKGNISV